MTRDLIPATLKRFADHGISATWATVGMLFARDKEQLLEVAPEVCPQYENQALNPYSLLDRVGAGEGDDPYHYAPSLIELIAGTPRQRIGSHTFSHYYCLENGASPESFAADLHAAQILADRNFGVQLRSLVYPRNQSAYTDILAAAGFTAYRGNPAAWFWRAASGQDTGMVQKSVRLLDHYLPIATSNPSTSLAGDDPVRNLPASRFFRPFQAKLDGYGGQQLKVRRILSEMTEAARTGNTYHLWWHPHNLATHPGKNMAALDQILRHFRQLHKQYGMESVSMEDMDAHA